MKTPMQEVFAHLRASKENDSLGAFMTARLVGYAVDWLLENEKSLLEKEKEVMCEFAFNCSDEIKDQNNWRSPRNLTNYEVILDFYNETFNTKEK